MALCALARASRARVAPVVRLGGAISVGRISANMTLRHSSNTPPAPDDFWTKIKGVDGASPPPRVSSTDIAASGVLSFAGIGSLSLLHFGLTGGSDLTMVLGCAPAPSCPPCLSLTMTRTHPLATAFGASAVLLYGAPAVPFSQPRNVIGGHMLSCAVGVGCHEWITVPMGTPALAAAVAVSTSIMGMHATRTLHPPAGGTALIAVMGSESLHALGFQLLVPTATGASILVALALGNNLTGRQYPVYWW